MSSESDALVAIINRLVEAVPVSESKLRGQLTAAREVVEFDAAHRSEDFDARHGWQRAVQLLGNRVLELKSNGQGQGQPLPEWVEQATAVTREYGMPNVSTTGE